MKAQLENGELSAAHGRAVLSIEGAEARVAFAREIVTRRLPKSEAERLAATRRARAPKHRAVTAAPTDVFLRSLADELTRGLGTRVRIARRARGGTIEIEFYSDGELERLVQRLRTPGTQRADAL